MRCINPAGGNFEFISNDGLARRRGGIRERDRARETSNVRIPEFRDIDDGFEDRRRLFIGLGMLDGNS